MNHISPSDGETLDALLPPSLHSLATLALDLRWTWSHAGDALWKAIDDDGWARTHNPYAILRSQTRARWDALAADAEFVAQLDALTASRDAYRQRPAWWQSASAARQVDGIAYFSMEFGLGEALPLYAGGLGVLAGDLLKTASDLGVPVTGIGLLYREGYFRQRIDAQGMQHAIYVYSDSADLPIRTVTGADGTPLSVSLDLPGRTLRLRVWCAQVGRVALYLLDSNDPWNHAADRGITGRLYAGGTQERLLQEIVLGVGGWRVVEALGVAASICHLNEGHAAFAALERARCYAQRSGLDFWTSLWATRAGNVFTTHTAIPAAFDVVSLSMLEPYARAMGVGIDFDGLAELGRAPDGPRDRFNMAFLAARCCGRISAVSQRHGEVSRSIFAPLYPRWPLAQVPVQHITNGVHTPSWDSPEADDLWTRSCGADRWLGPTECHEAALSALDDQTVWKMRGSQRARLVDAARLRVQRQRAERGMSGDSLVLDANVLTLGFARRFADYKRPELLLREQQRLVRLLTDRERPVQLVIAGKAHPDDAVGQMHLQAWVRFAQRDDVQGRVVILEDYDLALAEPMVQGVDVWINTPRPPWEACGTSGMKVLVNGGLNLSALDGWWLEAYDPSIGWAFGGSEASGRDRDAADADELLGLLEREIVPSFYERDGAGLPRDWIARIRASMARLAPRYSANRMLRQYVDELYLPAAHALARRCADGGSEAQQLHRWADELTAGWEHVHVAAPQVEQHEGDCSVSVAVYLGELAIDTVAVELYADAGAPNSQPRVLPMRMRAAIPGSRGGYLYGAALAPGGRPQDFTPRAVPFREAASVPLELPLVRWPR